MHRTLIRSIVISLLLLAPALARADDPGALGQPAASQPSDDSPRDAPASVELTLGVQPYLGIAGVDSSALGIMLSPTVDIGIALDPRVFLVLGGQFTAHDSDLSGSWASIWLPVLVHVYLDTPRVGAIVPSIRAGVIGMLSLASDHPSGYGGGLRVEGGVTWFADRAVALRIEVGGSAYVTYSEWMQDFGASGALAGRASVVIRI